MNCNSNILSRLSKKERTNRPWILIAPSFRHTALQVAIGLLVGTAIPAFPQFLDTNFNPNAGGNSNQVVESIALQNDGKILVGGKFTMLGGQTRNSIARLNVDGSIDPTFNPNIPIGFVYSIAVQGDGKILVGGTFDLVAGQTRNRIARLNADGSLDTSFNPNANDWIFSIALQADGKVLVGGRFTNIGGQTRNRIARLNADGTVDSAFNPNAEIQVNSIAVQGDGKILVGGPFGSIGGQTRNRIARLNANGTVDSGFNPNADDVVTTFKVQNDGKILAGGYFSNISGQTRNRIARLNADGSLDTAFNPNANGVVLAIALQSDGKILLGGNFNSVGGQPRTRLARVNANGSIDSTFATPADWYVKTIAVQPDGKTLLGGEFTSVEGQIRNRIARLLPEPAPSTRIIALSGNMAFLDVQVGQTTIRTLTIQNTGNSTLTVTGITFPAGFSGDWSGGSIPAGGVKSVTVTFTPTAAQNYGGNLTVASDATGGVSTLAVSGVGSAGATTRVLTLSGDLAFGEVEIGQSTSRTLIIGNSGNAALSVSGIGYPSGFSGDWSGGTIPAGGNQNIIVTFTPTALQNYGGGIVVASNATSGSPNRSISGTGIAPAAPPIIGVARSKGFPATAIGKSSRPQRVILTNPNSVPLSGLRASVTGRLAREFKVTQPAMRMLNPRASTHVSITFKPRGPGLRKATLILASDGPSATVQLSGRAR